MFDLKWSQSEKRVARRAFELALHRELTALIQETKERVNQMSTPGELWEVEHWLTERRREIDETYDYRYSVLPVVFAKLLRRRTLSDGDLKGLGPEKVNLIRRGFEFYGNERANLPDTCIGRHNQ
jgi:hypothetical protein